MPKTKTALQRNPHMPKVHALGRPDSTPPQTTWEPPADGWAGMPSVRTSATLFVPNTPAAPTLAQGAGSNLAVTWTAPGTDSTHSAATVYNLRSSPSGAGTWTIVSAVNSPYTLTALTDGAAYDVEVQAANTAGTTAWSPVRTLTTASTGPYAPNTPAAPALAPGSGTNLAVTWTAPSTDGTHSAATSYNLRSSPTGAGTWTTVSTVTSPYTLTGLGAAAAYDVEMQAANSAGTTAWSAITTLTTATVAPNAPAAPSLTRGAGSNLTVTWTAPTTDTTHSAATSYNLRSSPAGTGTWTTVSTVASPYTLTGLGAGAVYDVAVQGANTGGAGAWSAITSLSTASAGPFVPNIPAIASVVPTPDGTVTKLTVTWTAPATDGSHSAATGYNLRTSPAGAGTWTTMTNVTSPTIVTGLGGGTAMDVEVQATNTAGSGAWSAITTATTWGATVAPANWVAASAQVHGTSVTPNGGVNLFAVAAPTTVTAAAFAWSATATAVPTTGLIAAGGDGQTNGWGQWFNAPATAGTYYLWLLAQGTGGTIGALVTSAITVT